MKKRSAFLTCLSVVALFGFAASAVAGGVTVTLTGASGPVVDGAVVGPYNARIQGYPGLNSVKIICDDYDDTVHLGEIWTAHVSTLNNLSNVKFNSPTQLHDYEAALWLTQLMLASPESQWGSYHFAIWAIFSEAARNSNGFLGNLTAQSLYRRALDPNHLYDFASFSGWAIFTPDSGQTDQNGNPITPQEYFVRVSEASSLLLLAIALIGIILGCRKFNLSIVR